MARRIRVEIDDRGISELQSSPEVAAALLPHAERVLAAASRDPSGEYVASLRLTEHVSTGLRGRASCRVGAAPYLGTAVEAKRGTLARALGEA